MHLTPAGGTREWRVRSLAIDRRASQQCCGVTAGNARHNSSNVRGVTAGKVRRNSSNDNRSKPPTNRKQIVKCRIFSSRQLVQLHKQENMM